MTTPDIQQAREWAKDVSYHPYSYDPEEVEAAKIILNLPDQWLDAEKLRELVEKADEGRYSAGSFLLRAKELLPTPPLQTLADMSLEELKDYIGVKVTVDGWANPSMLVAVIGDEGAVLAHRLNKPWPFVEVLPLSALAPVAVPEQEAEDTITAESVEDVQAGRVADFEPSLPRQEEAKPGQAWLVEWKGKEYEALIADHSHCPWVLHDPEEVDSYSWCDRYEVTPIRRLRADAKENA